MNVRCRVELSQSERAELMRLMSGGKQAAQGSQSPARPARPPVLRGLPAVQPADRARKLKRAQILLAADAGAATRTSLQVSGLAPRRSTEPSGCLSKATWSER